VAVEATRDHVADNARGEAAVETEEEVHRLERKVNPLPAKPYAPAPRTEQEIVAEQTLDVAQDLGIARRVQPMAPVVQPLPGRLEAPRVPAHRLLLLEHGDAGAVSPAELVRGADPGRSGAKHDDVGATHA
jgi:hypothetical protein